MPDQFVVPQFIDAEDKIFGPITARQFLIMLITGLVVLALFRLLNFVPFLIVGIPLVVIGGVVAFVRINGQAFHYFLLNSIQTFRKPRLRVWYRQYSNEQLNLYINQKPEAVPEGFKRKEFLSTSRLADLSLVVNTGGVYKPED